MECRVGREVREEGGVCIIVDDLHLLLLEAIIISNNKESRY